MSENEAAIDYFIAFDTKINPGKVEAVRVRLDVVTLEADDTKHHIDLVNHPLYPDLVRYVKANKR